ncbi:MAG: hypothetical protein CMH31_04610 [Micavibrio sp.]|nr:hypothetical protein [Micavibrio sp.]
MALDGAQGFLIDQFDRTDPAYWEMRGDHDAYYGGSPPTSEQLRDSQAAAQLTLDERIAMRIKYGTAWHRHL